VVDAAGRSGRAADGVRAPASEGGPCGMAYVDRQYRLRDGAEPGPLANPLFWGADLDGYQAIVFLHERGTWPRSTPRARPSRDWPSGPTPTAPGR
jgi:hypothetical protein